VKLDNQGARHLVHACQKFDSNCAYFDWCHVGGGAERGSYALGKVVLLYTFWKKVPMNQQQLFMVDESYKRESWAINALDPSKWNDQT